MHKELIVILHKFKINPHINYCGSQGHVTSGFPFYIFIFYTSFSILLIAGCLLSFSLSLSLCLGRGCLLAVLHTHQSVLEKDIESQIAPDAAS